MSAEDSRAGREPQGGPPPGLGAADAALLAKVAPKERNFALLSGLGYYRLNLERRRQMRIALLGSAVAYAVALAAFGGWVVMRTRQEQQTIFTVPPPVRTYQPRELEHRVKVQQQQRSSSRPAVLPRLVAHTPSSVALPELDIDPKRIHTTFQPKFKAVSGMGLGAGLGTGYGTHGFGTGMANVDFFGIRARGEKIAILMDVSVSMVEEGRGGAEGYQRVRQRVEEVIEALPDTTLFNVVVFADAAQTMEPELMQATKENKARAMRFVRPYNTGGNWGLTHGNVEAIDQGVPAVGGTTRLDLALTASFKMGADTILIISDGAPRVRKPPSKEELAAWEARMAAWKKDSPAAIAAFEAAPIVEERVWIPPQPGLSAANGGLKEGQAPQAAREGHWEVVRRRQGVVRPDPPPRPTESWWTLSDFIQHLRRLHGDMYLQKGLKPPVVHCIGYQIDQDGNAFLRTLAQTYHGEYRRVQRMR